MRAVAWSKDALTELGQALSYIAQENSTAAQDLLDKIDATVSQLADMPIGRPGRVQNTYEKPVTGSPYIVAYHLSENTVTVLRVIHGRRNWPAGEWPQP